MHAPREKKGGRRMARPRKAPEAQARTGTWREPLGRPPSIENRHPSELEIDDSYQRSTECQSSRQLIRKIAREWDWRMCLPLVVSRREDAFYVIDGQHRLAAAKLRPDIQFLPCCISTYESVADEAAMFVAMNRTRKPIKQLDDFHASAAGGDLEVLAIQGLIQNAGFTVSRHTGVKSWLPGAVAFTETIRRDLRKHGHEVCADALNLMAQAFRGQILNAGASTFRALVKIEVGQERPDRDRLVAALAAESQQGWASFVSTVKGGVEERALAMKREILVACQRTTALPSPAWG